MRRFALPLTASAVVFALAGCTDASAPPVQPSRRAVALVEITVAGIGNAQPVASARVLPLATNRGVSVLPLLRSVASMDPRELVSPGPIQIAGLSTHSFTTGIRNAGGYRYVSATYQVRNAPNGGTDYDDPRTNLTFLAVNDAGTSGTLGGSAISYLGVYDGTSADPAIAPLMQPTGAAALDAFGQLRSLGPDILQVYTEGEVASLSSGDLSVLPYGFVVRNPNQVNTRTLDGSPAVDQFDGRVTFAYRFPLQAASAQDPFTISALFLAVDDDQAWVTQSLEEVDAAAISAIEVRAVNLTAQVRSLVGPTVGGASAEVMCEVRTAGTPGSVVAYVGATC